MMELKNAEIEAKKPSLLKQLAHLQKEAEERTAQKKAQMAALKAAQDSEQTARSENPEENAITVLLNLFDSGKIDRSDLPEDLFDNMIKEKQEAYVKKIHPYKICQGKDGRFRTHVLDPNRADKRKSIAKGSYEELIEALYDHYHAIEHLGKATRKKICTMRTLYPVWMEHKKLEAASDVYPLRINTDWKRFYENDDIVDVPLEKLTPLMLEEWALRTIKANQLTKSCYNNMTIIMRQALDYAVDSKLLKENPFRSVSIDKKRLLAKTKKKDNCLQVFTDEEVQKFEALAWDDFRKAGKKVYRLAPLGAMFMFYTGVRVGELTGLRFSDIINDQIHVQRMVRRDDHKVIDHTKSDSGDRFIPLTSKALEIIDAAKTFLKEKGVEPDGWIFSEYERPLPSRIVEEYYEKYCAAIGTPHKSTHCARKTFTSSLIDANINIRTVKDVVGHADERTTYHNYVFDRSTPAEKKRKFEEALSY